MTADRQAGVSLAELLIALTILLIVATGALTTYDNSVDAFKQGRVATEQQQGVRIAFDQMVEDLQMAGLNYDPDGDPNRTDESIEAAFDTAITVRGDYDSQDPVQSLVPETALAAGAFDIVTTGNDEIVTYVLAKPGGSGTSMVLKADVDDPVRDGSTESIVMDELALIQDDPPYTLYRITLNNDITTFGTPDFFVRTVLAENIGWLRFRYFDQAGIQLNPCDVSTLADDIGGGSSRIEERARIRRIEIDLLGLAADPDPSWVDWSDSNPATRSYRKFRLTADVRPRNNRTTGLVDVGYEEFGDL